MADVNEIRKQQLRRLVSEHEGMSALARKLGLARGAYISQLLTNPPVRVMSEKTARKWERALGLPDGWIDGRAPGSALPATVDSVNADLLSDVLLEVTESLKAAKITLPPRQLADFIVMQYQDALPSGRVDIARLHKTLSFMKR